jgi:eukaryotic-like serine/threonine-protein kinase
MSFGITSAKLDFEPIKEIGQQGRNSNVYLAHDKQLDAQLVIKKILKTKIHNPADFYSEAKRLYDSEHQHVVQIKYACEDTDHIYLAMPFYKNGSLKTLIDSRFLTVREILRYSIQFLTGLNNIHVKKLIHFDIKPDNILISDSNEAIVADFGLSKSMNSLGLSSVDAVYPKHMPPELFLQTEHSMLYDIYNSGLTIYRMCNGNDHYNSQGQIYKDQATYIDAIKRGKFPNRQAYLPHIPKSLRRVINKAISVNQADRHQTVLELVNDLSPINEFLDWKFFKDPNSRSWILEDSDRKIVVSLTWNTGIFKIDTHKTILASGNTSKISAACKNNLTDKDVDKAIYYILSSLQ